MTTYSNAALHAISPKPLIVHSICLAPAATPANEFEPAPPNSLRQYVEITGYKIFGTVFNKRVMR